MRSIAFNWLLICLFVSTAAAAENWSRFRGPNGAGQSDDNQIPTTWRPTNFLWKQPLSGIGHSSPVIWNKQLFLTWADASTGAQTVAAFDVDTGANLWQKKFEASKYHINDLNSLASSTPAVDAQSVYALWLKDGKVILASVDHQGEERWRQEIGPFNEVHGFGISPIVVDDLIYVNRSSGAESAITAFDRTTGAVRWNVSQDAGTTSFSTPCLLDPDAEHKVLLAANTSSGLLALDALTGKILWQVLKDDLDQRCVSSPIVAPGLILVGCGQGGNGKAVFAVRPPDGASPPQEVYRLKQNTPQVPTPVIAGDLLFVWSDRGVASCYDLATGKQHWRQR
ncbi:MAG TPA: PQQ-binding-like beta-propeller repeat protein, partial [Lacipirellulaceae bacterium]|nr:PQQ-binding-like beta-propeller repeat protein [Lacipirellulaceae bacterium]